MNDSQQVLYRYEYSPVASFTGDDDFAKLPPRVEIYLQTYSIIKWTPQGAWINMCGDRKFVLLTAKKRFACPTQIEALESFIKRKKVQISYLNKKMHNITTALNKAEALLIDKQEKEDL